ncbi:magnesium transporter [Seminavis robusta]|uniref:Magnesium transporter n=1 Tax=Seminavis robusta TaxID=568900 RepID=A0A9N8DRG8_9STRA|nr:magnesium transporter [Seminavis robusta]|eukprot:Sro201_g085240.1 magnesium transporter (318) ;mRNA; r:84636-85589
MKLSNIFTWISAQDEAADEHVRIVNLQSLVHKEGNDYGAMEQQLTVQMGDDSGSDDESHASSSTATIGRLYNWMDPEARASMVDSVFSTVRSAEDYEVVEETNESELYRKSSSLQRAMPERLFALTITLLLEIPVLMMVSGGSDALCGLIGRSRYQLLIGFLPLTSAISGNVGLQASTLTTRAISHSHITVKDFRLWLWTEVAAAIYLGTSMGAMLGSIAYVASGFDFAFGTTICISQLLSVVTAGLTGTVAPLLFSFLFKRDSGKWGGPLETAIQDIVGSFAMVIISYYILLVLGPGPIDPSDVCGPQLVADLSAA